jgi:PAS domain S-box-containing protein
MDGPAHADRAVAHSDASAYKRFFDMAIDLFAVATMDGHFKLLSPSFERVLGYSCEELLAGPFTELIHPDDHPATLAAMSKLQSGALVLDFQNRYRCKSGAYRWLEWTAKPDKHGLMFCTARDITEKIRLEHELSASIAQLRTTAAALEENNRHLASQLALVQRQREVIRNLETPILQVWDKVLTVPMLGVVDSGRAARVMDDLLAAVTRDQARFAILDLTGVELVDTATAAHLLSLISAVRLLGAEGIITGIRPNVAHTVVSLGLDLSSIIAKANLREGLSFAIRCMSADEPRQRGHSRSS